MYKDERLKIEPKNHKTFKGNWWNLLDADWVYVYECICVPLQIILQIRNVPSFFFSTTPDSPSKRARLDGHACAHQPQSAGCWRTPLAGDGHQEHGLSSWLPYYKKSKQKSSVLVAGQRSMQWAETCGDPLSAIQIAGGQMREFGTVIAKFRSGRKILHWTQHLLSSPEIADVDLNGLSNNRQWGIQTCSSSLWVKGGALRSCLTIQKQQGACRGREHLVGCLASTITTEPEKLLKTSVLDWQVTPAQTKGTVMYHIESAIQSALCSLRAS